jgi:hypothetical protein
MSRLDFIGLLSRAATHGGHAREKVRIAEGGISGDWNERSETLADIKILCGACYDRIRTQQRRTIF